MSLRKDLEALVAGETLVTEQTRTAVYVAAKRAGVTVTTSVRPDGRTEVIVTGTANPEIQLGPNLRELIGELPVRERIALLELWCAGCGFRTEQCVCVFDPEPVAFAVPTMDKLAIARQALADATAKTSGQVQQNFPAIPSEPEWKWSTKTKPYQDEQSGDWLRQRYYLDGNDKPVYQVVRVYDDDHDLIVGVK